MNLYEDYMSPTEALADRNHFLSPATRRAFKSRILHSQTVSDGLFFLLVESIDTPKGRRTHYVLFDVFGSIALQSEPVFQTSKVALRYFWEEFEKFDEAVYMVSRILWEIEIHQSRIADLQAHLKKFNPSLEA